MSDLQTLLQDAIELNLSNRKRFNDSYYQSMGIPQYLQQFGTIHIDLGRQTGKSTLIAESLTKNDIAIVHNYATRRNVYRDSPQVFAPGRDLEHHLRGLEPDIIYIDEPKAVFKSLVQWGYSPEFLYLITGRLPNQTYILLGE